MKFFRPLSILTFSILLFACGNSLPELKGVDRSTWVNDKNGCNGNRATMLDTITSQKNLLLALSEMEIVDVLGKPDQNELYKRNQKFYHYLLTPSAACDTTIKTTPSRLTIRFNAMGLAKEVAVE